MGRKDTLKKIVLKAFVKESENKNAFKCRFCEHKYAWNVSRMGKHLTSCCLRCPNAIKIELRQTSHSLRNKNTIQKGKVEGKVYDSNSEDSTDSDDDVPSKEPRLSTSPSMRSTLTPSSPSPSKLTPSTSKRMGSFSSLSSQSQTLDDYVDVLSEDKQNSIWEAMARACYASGTPLSFTENEHWRELFKIIKPSLRLPSRYQLSNSLLNKEYNRIKKNVEEKIKNAKTVGIQIDGWSNIRQEPIINIILTVPEPILYKTVDTRTNRHNAEYICSLLSEVINEIGAHKVLSVTSDNASNMKAAWNQLKEIYPNTLLSQTCYGCCAHILNLLALDIIKLKQFNNLITQCKGIVSLVKKSHILNETFKNIQQQNVTQEKSFRTLKLPGDTRWGSMCICLDSLINNKNSLQSLAINDSVSDVLTKHKHLKQLLLSDSFWKKVQNLYDILLPIYEYIKQVQTSKPYISHVIEIFYNLKVKFSQILNGQGAQIEATVLKLLENRKKMTVTPVHCAANILDPYLRGQNLNNQEYISALTYINDLTILLLGNSHVATILRELGNYREKEDYFQNQFIWSALQDGNFNTAVWWKTLCATTEISKIAVEILNCPATTAAVERSFSLYGNIHTKNRNRLTNERSSKLLYVNSNLQLFKKTNVTKKRNLNENSESEICEKENLFSCSESEIENDGIDESLQFDFKIIDSDDNDNDQLEEIILEVVDDEEEVEKDREDDE